MSQKLANAATKWQSNPTINKSHVSQLFHEEVSLSRPKISQAMLCLFNEIKGQLTGS